MSANNPYWLLREPGKSHGFGTVEFCFANTSTQALEFWEKENAKLLGMVPQFEREAVLVTMAIVDGQPVVTEVK